MGLGVEVERAESGPRWLERDLESSAGPYHLHCILWVKFSQENIAEVK